MVMLLGLGIQLGQFAPVGLIEHALESGVRPGEAASNKRDKTTVSLKIETTCILCEQDAFYLLGVITAGRVIGNKLNLLR